jgi:hypothetical protein
MQRDCVALGGWDIRIAWNTRQQLWWWSAWKASTGTELWGFVISKEQAFHAMTATIVRHDQGATDPNGTTNLQ